MANGKNWITMNGNHIEVKDGETEQQAIERFISEHKQKEANKKINSNIRNGNENHKSNSRMMLGRMIEDLTRKGNPAPFDKLQIPMRIREVRDIAKKYNVDISNVNITIENRNSDFLSVNFYGCTDEKGICLFPNAFLNEEQLIRTLVHEKVHAQQIKKYGKNYVDDNIEIMEKEAYNEEDEFWKKVQERKGKNGNN